MKKSGYHYVIVVTPFEDEYAARECLKQIRTAMNWVLLTHSLPHEATYDVQPVALFDDPKQAAKNFFGEAFRSADEDSELNAVLDASRPAIYPAVGTYGVLEGQAGTVLTGIRGTDVGETLLEGLRFPLSRVASDVTRLSTAFDLYRAHFTEATGRGRFLTLIMVLEALASPRRRPRLAIELIEQFDGLLENANKDFDKNSEESQIIFALRREIVFRKDDSIRNTIRRLVQDALNESYSSEDAHWGRDAVILYDLRSDLLHKGTLPEAKLNEALAKVKTLVDRVLRAQFLKEVQGYA